MNEKAYFDEVAVDWDHMREGFFPEAVRETALCKAGVKAGEVAADLGAGTGFITEGLLRKNLKVIAVDASQAMIDVLNGKFAAHAGFECRLGPADPLPLEDESVDYAFANMLLHHVERPPDVLEEMARILRKGGMLVVTDLDEHDQTFLKDEHHDRWMGFKRQDVRAWFLQAGLTDVIVGEVGEDCCAKSNDSDCSARVSIFVASGVKKGRGVR